MARKRGTATGPIFQVKDLTAGVNLRPSATNIQPNQARRLLNASISNQGELGVYPGFLTFMSSIGSDPIQGAKRIYLEDSNFTLAAANGVIYKVNDAGSPTSVKTGRSTTNQIDFIHDRDIVAAFDGDGVPTKSPDGSTWSQLGISAPVAAPTVTAVNNGGTLPNAHTYKVTYAYYSSNLNHTGNESAVGSVATATPNLTVRVAVVASSDPQVTHIKVYAQDFTAGETVRRLTETLANVSANHDITTNDWDAQEEPYTNHSVAEPMAFGWVWKNRWWGRDKVVRNRLRFSEIFQPSTWPATYYVDIPFQQGEDLMAGKPSGDTLVLFGYSHAFILNGQTALDFEVRPALGSQTGAVGFRAVDAIDGGVVHAGAAGLYVFNGATDVLLSYPIEPAWNDVVENSAPADIARVAVTYHKLTKELRVAVPRVYPTGAVGEWIMDLNRGRQSDTGPAWFSTDRTIAGYYQWDGEEASSGDAGRIFSWDYLTGILYEERVGVTADGLSRSMAYDGFMLPFGFPMARIIETYLEYMPANGVVRVDLRVDGRLMGTQTITITDDLPRYHVAQYHVARYAVADRVSRCITWPIGAEGRTAQFFLTFTGTGDFKAYTYGHNAIPETLPRGL